MGQSSASSQPYPVRADEAYVQPNDTLPVSISGHTGANFEQVVNGPAVSTTVTDEGDQTTITLTASATTVSEGGSITYTASVNHPVTETPLVVTLSNGQSITIPVGQSQASSQPYAVRADDAYVQPNDTLPVTISGHSGANFEAVVNGPGVSTTVTLSLIHI